MKPPQAGPSARAGRERLARLAGSRGPRPAIESAGSASVPRVDGRTFYRFVQRDPPTRRDFMSNKAKGRDPVGPEIQDPEIHASISVWVTIDAALDIARRRRPPRGFIARVDIPDGSSVTGRQTFGPFHVSPWGDPIVLLNCVVYPLRRIDE